MGRVTTFTRIPSLLFDERLEPGVGIFLFLVSPPPFLCGQLHVHLHLVLDGLGSVTKHQGGLGLWLIEGAGGAADDESGPGIAPETLLENSSQFTVSVRDVGFLKQEEREEGGKGY